LVGWKAHRLLLKVVRHESATEAHYDAGLLRVTDYGREGNGMEDTEGTELKSERDTAFSVNDFFEERFSRNPNKADRQEGRELMDELVTGVDTQGGQELFRCAHERWIVSGCPLTFDGDEDSDKEDIAYTAGSLADVIHRRLWHSFVTPEEVAAATAR
jgi:hypothetical protein